MYVCAYVVHVFQAFLVHQALKIITNLKTVHIVLQRQVEFFQTICFRCIIFEKEHLIIQTNYYEIIILRFHCCNYCILQ